jgi:hypothetical protein
MIAACFTTPSAVIIVAAGVFDKSASPSTGIARGAKPELESSENPQTGKSALLDRAFSGEVSDKGALSI